MVAYPNGFELIMGMKKDPVFGAVIMVGMGGTSAEVFRDRALALPPLNEALARRMLESLKSWTLLRGYRGKPPVISIGLSRCSSASAIWSPTIRSSKSWTSIRCWSLRKRSSPWTPGW